MAQLLSLTSILALALVAVTIVLAVTVGRYRRRVDELRRERDEEESRRRSLATTYGQITEQFAPLIEAYPWESEDFRFLGSPVDGVQFAEDRVVFVEFKANEAGLSSEQTRVKRMVERGDVEWRTFRIDLEDQPQDEPLDRWV